MNISTDLAKRGNEWIPRYLLEEENSEFVEFQTNPKLPSEITALFKSYPNESSRKLGVGARLVRVSYNRLDLKTLFVKFHYESKEEFYEKALDEVNKAIIKRYGTGFVIDLDEIDIAQCNYCEKMSILSVKPTCGFWFDRCFISNEK